MVSCFVSMFPFLWVIIVPPLIVFCSVTDDRSFVQPVIWGLQSFLVRHSVELFGLHDGPLHRVPAVVVPLLYGVEVTHHFSNTFSNSLVIHNIKRKARSNTWESISSHIMQKWWLFLNTFLGVWICNEIHTLECWIYYFIQYFKYSVWKIKHDLFVYLFVCLSVCLFVCWIHKMV